MNKVELLLPANSIDTVNTAFRYGADAVYVGSKNFSLRTTSNDFSLDDIKTAVDISNSLNKKLYVALNIYPRDNEIDEIITYLQKIQEIKPHGIIVADLGIVRLAQKYAADIDIHISTQANNTNSQTYNFYYDLGIKRAVSARELSLEEIKKLRDNIPKDMEIESFVHGAMCISYSGRCLLSNYFTKRDANKGECTHPCRWKYSLVEMTRPGEYLPIDEDSRGTYIMNSKDLCMIEHIDKLIDAGINSFKIEGRMKNALYIATCARTYRKAIDDYYKDKDLYNSNKELYKQEISKCVNRSFSTGFFIDAPDANSHIYENNTYNKDYIYLGTVEDIVKLNNIKHAKVVQKNKLKLGDEIEIIKPDFTNITFKVTSLLDDNYQIIESCPHPKQIFYIEIKDDVKAGDIIRMKS